MISLSVGTSSGKSKAQGSSKAKATATKAAVKAEQPPRNPTLTAYIASRSRLLNLGLASDHPKVIEIEAKIQAVREGRPVPAGKRSGSGALDLDQLETADQARRHVAALRATRTRREREGADKEVIEDLRKREAAIIAKFPDAKEPRRKAQAEPEEPEERRELWVERFQANSDAINAAIARIQGRRQAAQQARKAA